MFKSYNNVIKALVLMILMLFIYEGILKTVEIIRNYYKKDEMIEVHIFIDGKKESLYIDLETDRLYYDRDKLYEFPNSGAEPWIFSHDLDSPFIIPISQ